MAAPAVTYTFTNGTTSDATQVNTNFTNLINAMTDGTADFTIGTVSVAGAATFSGAVTLGNATADDITITGNLASSITVKTNATYNFGASTSGLLSVYLGNGANKTVRLIAGTIGTSYTITTPNDAPTVTGQSLVFDTNATASFRYPDKFTASKTGDYTATGDETIIPCAPSASMTVTLPAASTMTGKSLTIIKTDSDITKTVTIDANSSETILPSVQTSNLTYVLYTQYESVTLKCDGTSWYAVHHFTETPKTSFSFTIGAVTSAPTNANDASLTGYWHRRGSRVRVYWRYSSSAATGAANGSGAYLWPLPSGIVAKSTVNDSSATSNDTPNGQCGAGRFNRNGTPGTLTVQLYNTGNVVIYFTDSTTNSVAVSSTDGSLAGGGARQYAFWAEVEVEGWNP